MNISLNYKISISNYRIFRILFLPSKLLSRVAYYIKFLSRKYFSKHIIPTTQRGQIIRISKKLYLFYTKHPLFQMNTVRYMNHQETRQNY